jgi:hypothetical protein
LLCAWREVQILRQQWPIETYHPIVIINFTLFSLNPKLFQPPLLSSFVSTAVEGVLSGLPISGQP